MIRSITYGDAEYVFTDTPAVVTKDVTGTVTAKVKKNLKAKVTLTSDEAAGRHHPGQGAQLEDQG